MISEALDLDDRIEAADFVFRVARPDLSPEARRVQAFRYALTPGPEHGVLFDDADRVTPMRVRPGAATSPIYVARDGGRLVGAAICSCVVPDMSVRIMAHAVSEDYRGCGWGGALVRHVLSHHDNVGGAINADRAGLRAYASRLGLRYWYDSASDGVAVGFTQPIEEPDGLLFAVPIASKLDIARAEAKMRLARQSTFKRIAR